MLFFIVEVLPAVITTTEILQTSNILLLYYDVLL